MELRHLRYFVAVAEELNFRRAAERMYVAQGAFSEQVRKLEGELGVRLLDRTSRGNSLTEAGAALLPEARRVLKQVEVAQLAARSAHGHVGNRLRIGYMPASMPASVLRAARRVSATMPSLETSLEPGSGEELLAAIRAEQLDVAVISLPAPTDGLRVTKLADQRAVVAMPASHEHATRSEVRLDQLAPNQLVVLPREANRALYDGILASCRAAGICPGLLELPDGQVERALFAVAAGVGVAVIPECVAQRYATLGLKFIPLAGAGVTFGAAIVSRRDADHLPTTAFLRAAAVVVEPAAEWTMSAVTTGAARAVVAGYAE